jgi:AraC family transcriptional regulator of adaptative response / DNA-3-methyladenine glycosylase II
VSVASARGVAARLVQMHGKPLDAPEGGVTHTFPSASDLALADPATFPMPRTRQRTVHELASALADGRIELDAGVDRDDTEKQLQKIPGIGPWTTAYIRMRALNDPDVFLPTDLIVRRMVDPAQSEMWRPWRSYALMHVWSASTPTNERSNS